MKSTGQHGPRKPNFKSCVPARCHSFKAVCAIAVVLQFGVLASSAQTGEYLFTGSTTTITLNPGLYDITAYGAQGRGTFQYIYRRRARR